MAKAARLDDGLNFDNKIIDGSPNVYTNKKKAARQSDPVSEHPGAPPTTIDTGSSTVFINNLPAARQMDITVPHGMPPHPDIITEGSPNVYIG